MLRKYVYKFVISSGNGAYARQLFIDTFHESTYLQVGDVCTDFDYDTFAVEMLSDSRVSYTHKIGLDNFINALKNKGINAFYEIDKGKTLIVIIFIG